MWSQQATLITTSFLFRRASRVNSYKTPVSGKSINIYVCCTFQSEAMDNVVSYALSNYCSMTEYFVHDVQYRKWSPTANDPETANDPQNGPQMILDLKWSPKSTANDPERKIGMTWTQVGGSSCRFYYYYQNVRLKAKFHFSNKSMNKN